jgi:hypothetical protein
MKENKGINVKSEHQPYQYLTVGNCKSKRSSSSLSFGANNIIHEGEQ